MVVLKVALKVELTVVEMAVETVAGRDIRKVGLMVVMTAVTSVDWLGVLLAVMSVERKVGLMAFYLRQIRNCDNKSLSFPNNHNYNDIYIY